MVSLFKSRLGIICFFLSLFIMWSTGGSPSFADMPVDSDEPPLNSFLSDPIWPMCHRNSYSQGSSPYPGPVMEPPIQGEDFLLGRPGTITANFSSLYPDGGRVIWASCYGQIFKADPEGENAENIPLQRGNSLFRHSRVVLPLINLRKSA